MTRWVPAVLIGGVLGYGLIFLRELGWLIAVVVSLGLFIVYLRQGRLRDFGLLLVAQGVWPTFVASWASSQPRCTRTPKLALSRGYFLPSVLRFC
jgi:hypothetical protein